MSYYFVGQQRTPVSGLGAEGPWPPAFSASGKYPKCGGSDYYPVWWFLSQLGYDVKSAGQPDYGKTEKAIMAFIKMNTGGYSPPPDFCKMLFDAWAAKTGYGVEELMTGQAKMVDPALLAQKGGPYTPLLGPDQDKPQWMIPGRARSCPSPMVGTPPNCKVPVGPGNTCPRGMTGTPPYCVFQNTGTLDPTAKKPRPNVCVPPYIGVWPNCVLPKGDPGHMAWERCPEGYVGVPPDCRPGEGWVQVEPDVEKCPPGYMGTPPACIPSGGVECPGGTYFDKAQNKCVVQPEAELRKEGWSTGAMVAVGVGAAAVIGVVGYAVYASGKR